MASTTNCRRPGQDATAISNCRGAARTVSRQRATAVSQATREHQSGFTYIGLLLFIAVLGIVLALTGQVWHTSLQRERERELIFVGEQFRNAIAAYYAGHTGVGDRYPKSFDELLRDPHQPAMRRYLRKVYPDPFNGKREWGLIKSPAGNIMGVYSLAAGHPLKQAGFPERNASFSGASEFSGWQFTYIGGDAAAQLLPPEAH